jgi:hypothetical protein
MKTQTILVAVVALFLLTTVPTQTQAAEAVKINDTNVLFMIDVSVTASDGTYEVPIAASSRVSYNDRVDIIGYNLQTSDPETPTITTVTGLVLSDAAINGNRYTINEGESKKFTLFVLATFAEPFKGDALVSVSKLPYWIDGRRTTVHQNQLDGLENAVLISE